MWPNVSPAPGAWARAGRIMWWPQWSWAPGRARPCVVGTWPPWPRPTPAPPPTWTSSLMPPCRRLPRTVGWLSPSRVPAVPVGEWWTPPPSGNSPSRLPARPACWPKPPAPSFRTWGWRSRPPWLTWTMRTRMPPCTSWWPGNWDPTGPGRWRPASTRAKPCCWTTGGPPPAKTCPGWPSGNLTPPTWTSPVPARRWPGRPNTSAWMIWPPRRGTCGHWSLPTISRS